jgi:DNA-binding NtrC family response regulator
MRHGTEPSSTIMIVDDDENILHSMSTLLKAEGITDVVCTQDSATVLDRLREKEVGILLLDLTMPSMSGDELISAVREEFPQIAVAVVTGNRELERAVNYMKAGACDYLVKPVERSRLVSSVRRMIENQQLIAENTTIKRCYFNAELEHPEAFSGIVTASEPMKAIMRYVEAIAGTRNPVLVTGETGVGKELFARAIHTVSGREGEFVPVNIAGIDDELFSDLLFGHRAGSYTGATENRDGLIGNARDGTIFLDEIGDLKISSQVKLLRLLESGEYYPIGSDLMKRSRARIVVATNRDLAAAVNSGDFRKDLFYRLNIHHIRIPPLRDRLEDVPALAGYFIEEAARGLGRAAPTITRESLEVLQSYSFPGNVREFMSLMIDAVSSTRTGTLDHRWLAKAIGAGGESVKLAPARLSFPSVLPSIKEVGDLLVEEALKRSGGNQTLAARMVGITPQAISKRLRK